MKSKALIIALFTAACIVPLMQSSAQAGYGRQYYGGWSYRPQTTYYYRSYHYKPYNTYNGYRYHYCVYYPSRPRYVYYYNPYQQVYWGRYDLEAKGYSMLAEKDRKGDLEAIPDAAFPKPGAMPALPESKDGETITPIAPTDLPSAEVPKDVP